MIDERFPNWEIDVEKGTVYSLYCKKYIGSINNKGYLQTGNKINKNSKTIMLHRLIWECVNGEIPNGYEIHHIDGNKLNNSIHNLELVSIEEHHKEHKPTMNNPKYSKKIAQYTLDGELVKIWDSIREANRNGFNRSSITNCCKGKTNFNTHKGFKWEYYNEEKDVA